MNLVYPLNLRVSGIITERTRFDSAVNFRPGEEVPHLSSGTAPGVPHTTGESAGRRQDVGFQL